MLFFQFLELKKNQFVKPWFPWLSFSCWNLGSYKICVFSYSSRNHGLNILPGAKTKPWALPGTLSQLSEVFWTWTETYNQLFLQYHPNLNIHYTGCPWKNCAVLVTEETILVKFLRSRCHSKALYFSYFWCKIFPYRPHTFLLHPIIWA